ncbi:hypothetical protein WJX84_002762 [Apatococcus fuscideae]|uniref:Uncharacterized protein n=1 Tax=Apatococcus fuscideae TaxID=2026836 RepID=A0AAW1TKN3_9CHLO
MAGPAPWGSRYRAPSWAEPWPGSTHPRTSIKREESFQPLRLSVGESDPTAGQHMTFPAFQNHYRSSDSMPLLSSGPSTAAAAPPAWQPTSRAQINVEHSPAGWPQDQETGFLPHRQQYPTINHTKSFATPSGPLAAGRSIDFQTDAKPTMTTQPRFYPAPIPSPQPAQPMQRRSPGVANDAVHSVYGRPSTHSDHTSLAAPVHKSLQGTGVKMPKREAWGRFLAYEGCWQVCLASIGATQLVSSEVYRARTAWFGRTYMDQLYICLHPASQQGGQGAWTVIGPDGQGHDGDIVSLGPEDTEDELMVEIHDHEGLIAMGQVDTADLYQAAFGVSAEGYAEQSKVRHWFPCIKKLPCKSKDIYEQDVYGKKWVPIFDKAGFDGLSEARSKGTQTMTSWQVYDVALDAALQAQGCDSRNLAVTGDWEWLLQEFTSMYGIRQTYAVLAHLRWVVRPENATSTAGCLELLGAELEPLKRAQAEKGLLLQENALLGRIETSVEALLARIFESYYSLKDDTPTGILEGGEPAPEQPAPALVPAVQLAGVLRDVLKPTDAEWLTERFQVAADKRYHQLEKASEEQIPGPLMQVSPQTDSQRPSSGQPQLQSGGVGAEAAYARLEALCAAIKTELMRDLHIHDQAILPSSVNLPQITAAEYCKLFIARLRDVLDVYPPPQPSKAAVDLLVKVGEYQSYLAWHNLLPPPGHPGSLDAFEVFRPHVLGWILTSQEALCQRCRVIEATTYATAAAGPEGRMPEDGKSHVAPLVEEMLQRLNSEVNRYDRVISFWHQFGPDLEAAVCTVLRETTAAVTRQCGLVAVDGPQEGIIVVPEHQRSPSKMAAGGWPSLWRFKPGAPAPGANTGTVLPHEAVLLNSLRRMLTVVPQVEHLIGRWYGKGQQDSQRSMGGNTVPTSPVTGGPAPTAEWDGPPLGVQFAQLVKELRSEYGAAVTLAAERIATAVFSSGRSINAILQRHGLTGTPAIMQQQVEPVLQAMEDILGSLTQTLDGRVYVAMGRGLWDFTAREIYEYADELAESKENQGAWRGRQNAAAALDVVDNFFTAVLSGTLNHGLQSKDLDLPMHSDKAHKLLAENTAAINMSYTVY